MKFSQFTYVAEYMGIDARVLHQFITEVWGRELPPDADVDDEEADMLFDVALLDGSQNTQGVVYM